MCPTCIEAVCVYCMVTINRVKRFRGGQGLAHGGIEVAHLIIGKCTNPLGVSQDFCRSEAHNLGPNFCKTMSALGIAQCPLLNWLYSLALKEDSLMQSRQKITMSTLALVWTK